MGLTKVERVLLANQSRILAMLDTGNADEHNFKAEIAERGYEGLYDYLFENLGSGLSEDICKETTDILNMYRVINGSINALTQQQQTSLNLNKIKFDGFDANQAEHYSVMSLFVEDGDRYQEHKGTYYNSHNAATIMKYRRMLPVFNQVYTPANNHLLSYNDLQTIIAAI